MADAQDRERSARASPDSVLVTPSSTRPPEMLARPWWLYTPASGSSQVSPYGAERLGGGLFSSGHVLASPANSPEDDWYFRGSAGSTISTGEMIDCSAVTPLVLPPGRPTFEGRRGRSLCSTGVSCVWT